MENLVTRKRGEIPARDTWDLSKLFPNDAAWNAALADFEKKTAESEAYKGTLGASAERLADFLDFETQTGILEERLAYYADLRQSEDEGAADARGMMARFVMAQAKKQTAEAWVTPEILSIPDADIESFLAAPRLKDYTVSIRRILRNKPHILSEKEERIIALESEAAGLASDAFSVLTNVDLNFGTMTTKDDETAESVVRPLTQSTWSVFMESPNRAVRETAYKQFYAQFAALKTTLAALYAGSVKQDVIHARVRGFSSAREAALFADDVPSAVYDNLIATIHDNFGALHHYYELRKRVLGVETLRHYDVYAPLVRESTKKKIPWEAAVEMVRAALSPLGAEYTDTLCHGLLEGRWADRYENAGKRSGAFSAGSYTGAPYILMNYKDDSIRDVFTMAHEGGHSMHSWYSARNNPFMHYNYTIFEAEVASTFNEELLFRYVRGNAATKQEKLSSINKRCDEILATLFRQTMFAEFEKITHEAEEAGEALTCDHLRSLYRGLLSSYFGPAMCFEAESDLEGLRIPHFYRAFYVYKYATGISAALALAERVLSGGAKERDDYFTFLKSGGSRFPIESLRVAGVDMATKESVQAACAIFAHLVGELESLL